MMNKYLCLCWILALCEPAMGAEIDFSCNPMGNHTMPYGFDRDETYDVAILLDQPALTGSEIESISVPLTDDENVTKVSVWLSSKLNLKKINGKNANSPDIFSIDAEVKNGMVCVTLPTPYTITDPIYVGYSFTVEAVNDLTATPVIVAESEVPGGLWIHTSRTRTKWTDISLTEKLVSMITVSLNGELKDNAAAILPSGSLLTSLEDGGAITLNLANYGNSPVKSVSGVYSVDAMEKPFSYTLPDILEGQYGAYTPVVLNLEDIGIINDAELKITVDKINGATNENPVVETIVPVTIYPFIPINRPLVEEYTGMWCGYCPRGYVALETMREEYPERFVGLAYHNRDALEYVTNTPSSPSGYPSAYINRGSMIDASTIYSTWPVICEILSPVKINTEINWSEDENQTIKVKGVASFIEDYDADRYGMSFALVADGLSNPTWLQSNSYAPREGQEPVDDPEMPGEIGYMFTHGTNPMPGLIYNDVVLAITSPEEYVLPKATIGEEVTASTEFDITSLHNTAGEQVVEDFSKVRCVAIVVDLTTNRPVNCISSPYLSSVPNSISKIETDSNPIFTEWYDLQGRKLSAPVNNAFIIEVRHFENGKIRCKKVRY